MKHLKKKELVCLKVRLYTCTFLLCAEDACCPGRIQRVQAVRVQREGGQDWGPSCCERSLERAQGWGQAWPLERDQDPGKGLDEECLPWGGLVWTSPWITCSCLSSRDLMERGWEDVTEEAMMFANMQYAKVMRVNE